jgi:hypothetical protein
VSQNPYYSSPPYQGYPTQHNLAQETLKVIEPVVKHGLKEVAAISYLIGKGYDYNTAHQIVESWEHMGFRL